ncbi:hypothetical protein QV08_07560 [Gallibacterium salpingitidis]|uniref:Hemophilus-specific protein n=2 Tax=Gallibacterium TaxID=155493 RepID=A0A1A7PZD8_9PAST|nr:MULTISPECIES: hypothetical protein [Gallibacterium]OBW94244.1 hypothetical protein QV02_08195 [Gallibacterium anatis]OBW98236.1 hypothetical protein QV03_07560 [Gallibacterium anatis]OBX07379.1 hypothetical protein QV07_07105 [Gallibacterium genomosp. 3]OBX07412.1 hypothetical protein QV08_07560 [Gallibacterium salpingitidis]WKS98625.1 hypothetical protein NYR30_07485 [Gallibacterium salpingitidis]
MQVSIHHQVLSECSKPSFISDLQKKALNSWLSSNQIEPVRFLGQTSNYEGYKTYHFFEVSPHQTLKNVLVVRG